MKILFDTNVIIDALQGRKPWCYDAQALIMAVANEKIEGFVTAKELCDIWYLAKAVHKGEKDAHRKAKSYISDLCKLFYVLDTSREDIEQALYTDEKDFEDIVMYSTARREVLDGIVTRNVKDYPKDSTLKVWDLGELRREIG